MKVEVNFVRVNSVRTAIKLDDDSGDLIAAIQLEAGIHPSDIARLLNLQKNKMPLYCIIGSNQAELDLKVETINVVSGELTEAK